MTVADRWFYFPFVGALGLLGLLHTEFYPKKMTKLTVIFFGVLLILLGSRTFLRNYDWKDPITLYEKDLQIDQNNFFLENILGAEYLMKGDYQKAEPHIRKSLTLHPYFGNLNNMAVISSQKKEYDLAKSYLQKAIEIDNNYIVTENYAKLLYNQRDTKATLEFIEEVLLIYPNNATLWLYRGLSEERDGNHESALLYTKKAYDLAPNELTKSSYEGIKNNNLYKKSIQINSD